MKERGCGKSSKQKLLYNLKKKIKVPREYQKLELIRNLILKFFEKKKKVLINMNTLLILLLEMNMLGMKIIFLQKETYCDMCIYPRLIPGFGKGVKLKFINDIHKYILKGLRPI